MVLSAEVRDESGERAATGTMGLSGHDAIADRILTSPAHRRHGLGGAVMSALSRAALDQGASRGILLASEDGQRLYKALGWQPVSGVLIATTPGNTYPE
jgi:GNAT superfamily N-acetyltransferase